MSKILTIDQDLRPPADFGEANLGWDPLIIGDVHHCRRISMRGQLLMTRGLLFKSKDHVIQPLGGISTSLKSMFLILRNTLLKFKKTSFKMLIISAFPSSLRKILNSERYF